jgi:hypothetical protein
MNEPAAASVSQLIFVVVKATDSPLFSFLLRKENIIVAIFSPVTECHALNVSI